MTSSTRPPAIGLVHRPRGTASADRSWARSLVIRHARDARLDLVDIYELGDDGRRNANVLDRLADLVATSGARVLVTDGVQPALVTRLVGDLGLAHEPVPARWHRHRLEA
jgi:hypothetical protein